jgi:imidazoleglycerol phosphate synthase glutamine amidotransferase subunit HisH
MYTSYLVSYGAGNVRSLANAISSQGFEFKWIEKPEDFEKADVSHEINISLFKMNF